MSLPEKIRAILWDVDGTLFSAEGIIAPIYQRVFQSCQKNSNKNVHIPSITEILKQIGKPVQEIFQNLAPELSPQEQSGLSLQVLAGLVQTITFGGGEYYDKMTETLAELYQRGYQFFSVSNGRYPYIEAILRSSKTIGYFQEIRTLDNKQIKAKTELVKDILKRHRLSSEEVVLIGDRLTDRDAAYYNGVAFIAAGYGHGNASEWQNAALIIHSIKELLQYLPPKANDALRSEECKL